MQNGYRSDNTAAVNGGQDRAFDLPETRMIGAGVMPEPISTSAVFQLTDRLPIFSYLVSPNRIRWYRVIMRFFFHSHRELYR